MASAGRRHALIGSPLKSRTKSAWDGADTGRPCTVSALYCTSLTTTSPVRLQPLLHTVFEHCHLPFTCALYLRIVSPKRHMCVQVPCRSRESFKKSLRYDCDVVMGGLHHTASRRVPDVPSQRSRHAFFLTAGVEGQVSIDAFTSANPLFARAQQRTLLENRSWPVRLRLREIPQITYHTVLTHVSSLAADRDVRV